MGIILIKHLKYSYLGPTESKNEVVQINIEKTEDEIKESEIIQKGN